MAPSRSSPLPVLLLLLVLASGAPAQPPSYDFDWVTVGAPGNAPYAGPGYYTPGRGSVGYEFRISRYETTTAQWLEFYNAFSTRPGTAPPNFAMPQSWGATPDEGYTGPGTRYRLADIPGAAMVPVSGINWRTAARYCNWLCNNKAPSFEATSTGAYDASTFTFNPNGSFNDQLVHTPGAPFWIPTLDEQMKAGHYDPNRYGPGQPGWWQYPDCSDEQLIPGPPGIGQCNAGFDLPNFGEWYIPLGSYPQVQSPWGLLDVAGGTEEWNEESSVLQPGFDRGARGSAMAMPVYALTMDSIRTTDSLHPLSNGFMGFRVAGSIPAPCTAAILLVAWLGATRRRPGTCHQGNLGI